MGCSLCRTCVSKNKKRTKEDPYDLDLIVLSNNVTVMGYPSVGLESCYRNPYEDVLSFLDRRFGNDYLVINLCSESVRQYDANKCFHGRCVSVPFPDHTACELSDIPKLVHLSKEFIKQKKAAGKNGMVAIHCKAGKGRSGLMACALLMALMPVEFPTADSVMLFYGKTRTDDGKGLTVPSQRRYVEYYEKLLTKYGGEVPKPLSVSDDPIPSISLNGILISSTLWDRVKSSEVIRIRVGRYDTACVVQFYLDSQKAKADGVVIQFESFDCSRFGENNNGTNKNASRAATYSGESSIQAAGTTVSRDAAFEDVGSGATLIDLSRSQFGLLRKLKGDIRIDFLKSATGKSVWLASLSIHTLFIKPFYGYKEIDKLYKCKEASERDGILLKYTTSVMSAPDSGSTGTGRWMDGKFDEEMGHRNGDTIVLPQTASPSKDAELSNPTIRSSAPNTFSDRSVNEYAAVASSKKEKGGSCSSSSSSSSEDDEFNDDAVDAKPATEGTVRCSASAKPHSWNPRSNSKEKTDSASSFASSTSVSVRKEKCASTGGTLDDPML